MRLGPSTKDRLIRYVPRKAEVEILETMGEWAKVKLQDGTSGWMHESHFLIK
jgi:SH3-like domain-containing protein